MPDAPAVRRAPGSSHPSRRSSGCHWYGPGDDLCSTGNGSAHRSQGARKLLHGERLAPPIAIRGNEVNQLVGHTGRVAMAMPGTLCGDRLLRTVAKRRDSIRTAESIQGEMNREVRW